MPADLRAIGPGRFEVLVRMPWGEDAPAELLVATAQGWGERPEANDPRWTVYRVGPAVLALRLIGERPTLRPKGPRARMPARSS